MGWYALACGGVSALMALRMYSIRSQAKDDPTLQRRWVIWILLLGACTSLCVGFGMLQLNNVGPYLPTLTLEQIDVLCLTLGVAMILMGSGGAAWYLLRKHDRKLEEKYHGAPQLSAFRKVLITFVSGTAVMLVGMGLSLITVAERFPLIYLIVMGAVAAVGAGVLQAALFAWLVVWSGLETQVGMDAIRHKEGSR